MDNSKNQDTDKQKLRDVIKKHYNISELRELCFDLDINYEDLGGEVLSVKVIELIEYSIRNGKLGELIEKIEQEKPHAYEELYSCIVKAKILIYKILRPKQKQIVLLAIDISGLKREAEQLFIKGTTCLLCSMLKVRPDTIKILDADKSDGKLLLTLQAPPKIAQRLTKILTKNDLQVQNELPGIEIISFDLTNRGKYLIEASVSIFAQHYLKVIAPLLNDEYERYEKEISDASAQSEGIVTQATKQKSRHKAQTASTPQKKQTEADSSLKAWVINETIPGSWAEWTGKVCGADENNLFVEIGKNKFGKSQHAVLEGVDRSFRNGEEISGSGIVKFVEDTDEGGQTLFFQNVTISS